MALTAVPSMSRNRRPATSIKPRQSTLATIDTPRIVVEKENALSVCPICLKNLERAPAVSLTIPRKERDHLRRPVEVDKLGSRTLVQKEHQ